jgi:SAM-dependent methyltransferase
VTRHLVGRVDASRIWSSDIIAEAVRFVGRAFGVNTLVSTQHPDRLQLSECFDLIIVSSLFSHLPRNRFAAWLERLGRALSPTGLLVFSTHGEELHPEVAKHPSGFTFVSRSETRLLDLDEYGSTFVSQQVVEAMARESGLEHLYGLPRELWQFQDVYAVSRVPVPGLEGWRHASGVKGMLDECWLPASGGVRVEGWVGETCPDEEVVEVFIESPRREPVSAHLGLPRDDVAVGCQRADWARAGWVVEDLGYVPAPGEVLIARAVSSSGRSLIFDMTRVGDRLTRPRPPGGARA